MKDAQLSKFEVEKGDIVIMGSDGLSDNLVRPPRPRPRIPSTNRDPTELMVGSCFIVWLRSSKPRS